jgi:SAM-dependent methyltransferase
MQGYQPSTYGEGFADVYDEWYHDVGDLEGCADAIAAAVASCTQDDAASGGAVPRHRDQLPVLELGAGTGRLAVPISERGVPVVGVDASMAMLERLRARTDAVDVEVLAADLAALPLRGPVRGAVLAFNTLFNLASCDAQQAFFHDVARILAPGGFVAAELFVPAHEADVPDAVVEPSRIEVDRVVLTASIRDRATQVVSGQHIELTEAGGVRLRPWMIRYADPEELDDMATRAGLELWRREASWRGGTFDEGSAQHVSWWRRPR